MPRTDAAADSLPESHEVKQLSRVIESEARRVLSEDQFAPDPVLIAQGWERRFMTDARKAEEMIELYSRLDYEVCVKPVESEDITDECEDCQLLMRLQFQTIYTRRKERS